MSFYLVIIRPNMDFAQDLQRFLRFLRVKQPG